MKPMKTVTLEQILAIRRCNEYPEGRVRELAGGKDGWTALDILRRDDIPADDRLWLALRPELLDAATAVEFACRVAEDALALVDKPNERSAAATAAARAYMRGEITAAEMEAARDAADAAAEAAWDVAEAVARAAWYAARAARAAADAADAARAAADAAWYAARAARAAADAADAAARTTHRATAAAIATARDISRYEARVAARGKQVKKLIELLVAETQNKKGGDR